jgi:beta-lactamase superfamily II metal-dependent hydrolase
MVGMVKKTLSILLVLLVSAPGVLAAPAGKTLDIYFIDVEGGAATLVVTPAGESLLVDTGWKRDDDRDAKRIHDVATRVAGLTRIDHLVTTHWHMDHYGGLGRLAEMMPVGHFYDHGIPASLAEDTANFPTLIAAYKAASHGQSTTLHPGDSIALRPASAAGGTAPALRLRCLAADGKVIGESDGTPPAPPCGNELKPVDTSDNARSVVLLLSYGAFDFFDGGDLTWNVEHRLVCPTNRVGRVDAYQVDHHGLNASNNPVLIEAIQPRVAIMNNGPQKGGHPDTVKTLRAVKGLEAFYQVHRNIDTTPAENAPAARIANMDAACKGEYIHLSVAPDGQSYTVTVGSQGKPERYACR